ncbi:MAG: adenylate/guanylate cyclase domain-containing protein [Ilumatobacteraceae bacterium]
MTFLFTDLEGSTPLWNDHEEAMQSAVAGHDAILRRTFERNGGYVFTTAGDSFAVAFPDAQSAVNAGVALQREMMATTFDEIGQLRVRVGLHTGTAELRDGDYFGSDVNLAARIMSSAHGGQILVSLPTALLAGNAATLDLGKHHLKGVRDACSIHQVVVEGLPNEFPPLRTSAAPLTNLPQERTELVGREREAQRVVKMLEEHRLISLVGPGGIGKTALATTVARSLTAADGTWFIDLAPVASHAHIATAFADAVGVTESGSRPLGEQVINHLRDRETVLVVDNCEHIIDGAAQFVDELLSRVPAVRVLATSRELLDLPDEGIVTLGPLEVPGVDAPEFEMRTSAALRLFGARAAASDASVDVVASAPAISAEICRLVDGMPLAIELAAARLRTMSVDELADHLRDQFSVLSGGRGRGARHRTLDAVIEWSYGLLDTQERAAFEQLSVFAGGFTADAVAAVLPAELGGVMTLARLVDKSLVVSEPGVGGTRYRMFETLRAFAGSKLAAGDAAESAREAHLAWCLGLIDRLEAAMRTPGQDAALAAVRPEHDNLRAARSWAESRDPIATLRITVSAPIDSWADRGRRLAEEIAAAEDASPELLARAQYTTLGVMFEGGDFAAGVPAGREAVALYEALGDRSQAAFSQLMLSYCLWGRGLDEDVDATLASAQAAFDELDDTLGRAYVNWTRSQWRLRNPDDLDDVVAQARLGAELFRQIDSPFGVAHGEEGIGHALAACGELEESMMHMLAAARSFHDLGHLSCMSHALDGVALVLALEGRLLAAAEIVGAAEGLRDATGSAQRPWEADATDRCVSDLREALAPEVFEGALQQGRELRLEEILDRVEQPSAAT